MMTKWSLITTWLFIFFFSQNINFPGEGTKSQSINALAPSIFHAPTLPQLIGGASAKAEGADNAKKDASVKKKE